MAPPADVGIFKRFNDGVARGEAALALVMLLLMVVVAFAQAFLRNMTNAGFQWANAALGWLDWADFILTKGTLWLAFLGASLGVHGDKHVNIDILPRFVSPRARIYMRVAVGLLGAVICFYLSRAFWAAVLINGEDNEVRYELLTPTGTIHACDATPEQLAAAPDVDVGFYCYVRSLFSALGVKMETPGAAFQLVVPVMFMFMAVRMFAGGIQNIIRVKNGDFEDDISAHGITGNVSDVAHDLEQHGEG